MAKKNDKETALTVAERNTAMAVADGVDHKDTRGKEGIDTQRDVTLPRVGVCQNNSPEKDEDSAKFIEGLGEGDLFNSLTTQIYGDKDTKLNFVVIRVLKRAMEFDKDRNIVDYDVPWDDARCEFTTDPETRDRVKPVATRFYDFVVYLPDFGDVAIISMSNTKIAAAKKLNSLIALRPGPSWAGLYTLGIVKQENDSGKFFNFTINPKGKTPADVMEMAEGLYTRFANMTIKTDAETAPDPDAPGAEKTPF